MKYYLLHLSDLHIGVEIEEFEEYFNNIYTVTKNAVSSCDLILIVVSGDISDRGSKDGYINASLLLNELIDKYKNLNGPIVEITITPGNHDCHFGEIKNVRERLIRDIIKNEDGTEDIDSATIDLCTEPQEHFFDFISDFDSMSGAFLDNKVIWKKTINIKGNVIDIFCINSAWMTSNPEKQGKLILPETLISKHMQPGTGLTITLMHHPLNWFKPWNSKRLRDYFESCSNLIFTGHEHWPGLNRITNQKSEITYYSDGNSLNGSSSDILVTYLITKTESNTYSLDTKKYDIKNLRSITNSEDEIFEKEFQPRTKGNYFHLNTNIKEFINDIGASIRHPQASIVKLDDIFIYPDLNILNSDPLKKRTYESTVLNSENSLVFNKKLGSKYIILGQSRSGRTTLLKKMYGNLLHDGLMPIWIKGEQIKSTTEKDILKLIDKEAGAQYKKIDINEINILDNDKKVLLIDDFDQSKLPRKYRRKFMNILKNNYINIVIISHDLLEIEELTGNEPNASIIYDGFKAFKIKEFGNLRRSQLIKKWFSLNTDPYTDINDQLRIIDNVTGVINVIIGKNLTPSQPLILLVLLQNITSIDPDNFEQSSYGYYYQSLITESLQNVSKKPKEINSYKTFLSALAYSMFEKDVKFTDDHDFNIFCTEHAEKYDLQNKIHQIVTDVISSEVLYHKDGKYIFTYKYIYYYFIAQYLSDKISQIRIKTLISKMAENPHNSNYSNILMFLSYISKDPIIIESLLNAASKLFPAEEPIKLESDIDDLNKLYKDLPELVLEFVSVEEARDSQLKDRDRIEEETTKDENDEDVKDKFNVIDNIAVSFKLAEIIGQVVKNSFGSLESEDKYNLIEKTYNLVLKPLGLLLRFIMENPDNLASEIGKVLKKQPLYDLEDRKIIEAYTKAHLTRLCSVLTYTFISRISQFVGSEDLDVTLVKLLNKNENTAFRLIDATIKIDHFSEFPISLLRRLNADLSSNPLAKSVISHSVKKYLYMFNIENYKDKQKICQEFGLKMPEARIIERVSKENKGDR